MSDMSQGQDTGTGDNGNGTVGTQAQPPESTYGESFLKQVSPEHLPTIEPYVKQWDAGVTRRFQDLQGQLKPYQELGDYDTLQQAIQLYQTLDTDPQRIYEILHEEFGQQQQQGLPPVGTEEYEGEQFQGLPPEIQQRIDKQEELLKAVVDVLMQGQQQSAEQQEDAELDNYLGLLGQEFGEFDEDFVLAKMYAGMDGAQAVQAWQQTLQSQINNLNPQPKLPPTLSGGGVVPAESQNVANVPRKDIRNFVAGLLEQSANS